MDSVKSRKNKPAKNSLMNGLRPEESATVLRRLLAAHPDLEAEAENIAKSVLHEVDLESIANEVEDAVRALDYDDLNGRAGRHEWGYVEPGDAAMEILEETVEPFIEDLKRHIDLGLEADALEVCKGLILGLYRLEHGENCTLMDWAPDFPSEAAGRALETWRDGGAAAAAKPSGAKGRRKRSAFPQEFVEEFVPEWSAMIARILPRARKNRG